jgi:hypothetical protein
MAVDDRREGPRVTILGELRGEVMVFQPMTVTEVSRGGAQVETAFPLQLDSLHDFRLSLGSQSVIVKGRIVHCRIADVEEERVVYRAGVEFVEPSEHARNAIEAFLGALNDSRRGL